MKNIQNRLEGYKKVKTREQKEPEKKKGKK